jgi:hypothetical protein
MICRYFGSLFLSISLMVTPLLSAEKQKLGTQKFQDINLLS